MGNQNVLPLTMYAVLAAYDFPETLLGVARYGQGHINDTYCVVCQPQEGDCVRFILQGLSMAAFPHPEELMENIIGITSYLCEKIAANGGDTKRETLSLVKTKDGMDFFTDSFGKVWRLTHFVEGTDCFQSATPELLKHPQGLLAVSSICGRIILRKRCMKQLSSFTIQRTVFGNS